MTCRGCSFFVSCKPALLIKSGSLLARKLYLQPQRHVVSMATGRCRLYQLRSRFYFFTQPTETLQAIAHSLQEQAMIFTLVQCCIMFILLKWYLNNYNRLSKNIPIIRNISCLSKSISNCLNVVCYGLYDVILLLRTPRLQKPKHTRCYIFQKAYISH